MSYKEDILKLRKQGKSYGEIQEEIGCSKGTIHYHCSKLLFDQDITLKNREKFKRVLPNFDKKEIIIYLVNTGTSRKIIADALRISYDDLVFYCKKNNIKTTDKLCGYAKIKQHRRNKKILAALYLGGKCEKCNYNKSYSALEFHHKDPAQKDFTIAKNTNLSWEKMKKEIEKCKLLCANCHREIHDDWL